MVQVRLRVAASVEQLRWMGCGISRVGLGAHGTVIGCDGSDLFECSPPCDSGGMRSSGSASSL